jgi:hydroxypyruvate isomerase
MFKLGVTVPAVFSGDTIQGIERAATAGADGVEFFDWENVDTDALRDTATEHGIDVYGTLAADAGRNIMDPDAPSLCDPNSHEQVVEAIERSIEGSAAIGCQTLIVTVGQNDATLDDATQQTAIVAALRAVAPLAETNDVTLVVEPLNTRVDHPGYFLTTTDQGVAVVDAVDSPNVKLLFDVYHQQITEGDVIRRLRQHSEHIGHIHIADNPGRHEPGTGELEYARVFETIAALEYDGYVGCEFSPVGDPDVAIENVVELANEARP